MSKLEIPGINEEEIWKIYFGGDYLYILMFTVPTPTNKSLYIVDARTLEIVHESVSTIDHEHDYQV